MCGYSSKNNIFTTILHGEKMIGLEVLGLLDFETNKDRKKVDVEAPTQGDTI